MEGVYWRQWIYLSIAFDSDGGSSQVEEPSLVRKDAAPP